MWSGFYVALAFILLHYFDNFITSFCARLLGYKASFNYHAITAVVATESPWTLKRVAFIYLTSPLLLAATGFGLLIFLRTTYSISHFSLIIFWFSFVAYVLFYSYFFFGLVGAGNYHSPFYIGFATFFAWLGFGKISTAAALIAGSVFWALPVFFYVRPALRFIPDSAWLKNKNGKLKYFVNVILFPMLFGIVLLTAITYPMALHFHFFGFLAASVLALVFFLFLIRERKSRTLLTTPGGIGNVPMLVLVIPAAALYLFTKYLLSITIAF